MLSCPPATTTEAAPDAIAWQPRITDFRPEAQSMFTIQAGTVTGRPAFKLACRAGFCPCPSIKNIK